MIFILARNSGMPPVISMYMKAYILAIIIGIPSVASVSDCGNSSTVKASIALRSGGRVYHLQMASPSFAGDVLNRLYTSDSSGLIGP